MTEQTVGIIGLGSIGLPIAHNLLRSGIETIYANRTQTEVTELRENGGKLVSLSELGEFANTIVLSLPDGKAVDDALFGEGDAAKMLAPGSLIIDTTTSDPSDSKRTAERLAEEKIDYVDAPVSGGPSGAENATLSIMVGCTESVFERCLPLLEVVGKTIVRLGGIGAGQTAKACNQLIVGVTIEAVAEALAFASRSGLDPWRVREALLGGFAGSPVFEIHGERMLNQKFSPAAFTNALQSKDLNIVCTEAERLGLDLPAANVANSVFSGLASSCETRDLDHSSPFLRFHNDSNK